MTLAAFLGLTAMNWVFILGALVILIIALVLKKKQQE